MTIHKDERSGRKQAVEELQSFGLVLINNLTVHISLEKDLISGFSLV